PSRAGPGGRLHHVAPSLLDLRKQRSRKQVDRDVVSRAITPVAGCLGDVDGFASDGRDCHSRLFRAAQAVAGSADERQAGGLVAESRSRSASRQASSSAGLSKRCRAVAGARSPIPIAIPPRASVARRTSASLPASPAQNGITGPSLPR